MQQWPDCLEQVSVQRGNAHDETMQCATSTGGSLAGITVMATSNSGNYRSWDKKYYCVYCEKPQSKLPRHLETTHQDEPEVVQALSDKDKKSRQAKLTKIRNLGNHKHNCEVLKSGVGAIIVSYRPKASCSPEDYGPCQYCYAYLVRKDLWKHKCQLHPAKDVDGRNGKRKRYAQSCKLLFPPPKGASEALNSVLCSLKQDAVSRAAKNDALVMQLARKEYLKAGHDSEQHDYIRAKLREMGRLILELRQKPGAEGADLESFIDPTKFREVVSAAKNISGFSETAHTYCTPSLALKIGHSVKKCALILKGQALETCDGDLEKRAEAFHQLCEMKWSEEVSSHALRTLYQNKRNKTKVLPRTEDVIKLTSYLKETGRKQVGLLKDDNIETNCKIQAYDTLNSTTLTSVLLFNRRRQGEASKMMVSDYTKKSTVGRQDVVKSLSNVEQELCKMVTRVELVGKRGQTVPVLFTAEMKTWIDLLLEVRAKIGIPTKNSYVFARSHYGSLGHIRASDCLREASIACGAKQPENLRGTQLRKQIATLSQILNLKENEMDMLAKFLGHDIRIHREYYRLPENTLQVAKVAKLLLAMERGTVGSLAGKTLDDIVIDPNEGLIVFIILSIFTRAY